MVVTIIKIVFAVVFCLLLGCVIIYLLYRWKPDSLKKMAVLLHELLNNAPSNCTGSHKGTADESIAETSELSIDLNTREEFSCPNSKIDSLVASIRQLEILIKEHDAHLNKQVSTIAASIQLLDKKLSGGMLFAMQTASSKMRVPTAANERYPQIFYAGILDENNIGFPLESLTLDDAGKWFVITQQNSSKASYCIVPSELIREQMLARFDTCIKPGCDYGDSKLFSPTKIQNVEDGKLTLQSDLWVITQKVKIKIV